jgi:hypothetical protein
MLSVAWDTVLDLVVVCADVAKCFPRADRKVMLKELAGQGVWGNAWHMLRRMDEGLRGRVMVSGELSEVYAVLQGFLEGDISCPLKCNVLMRAILTDLRTYVDPITGEERPLGVVLHGKWVGGSLFLDDSILLARGIVEAQLMCDIVVKRIEDYMISFSGPKTMAVRVNTPVAAAAQPLATLWITGMVGGAVEELDSDSIDRATEAKGGWRGVRVGTTAAGRRQKVAMVEAAARVIQKTVMKYLGVWYKSGGAVNSKHGEYVVSKARRVVGRLAQVGCFEGGLSPAVALDHAESKFGSTVTYGCIAWAYVGIMGKGIGITAARDVERAQLSLARAVLNAPKKMPAAIVLGEAGWTSVTLQWAESVLQEWATIKASRVVLEGDVAAAVAGEKCSELGDRVVGAAELVFGMDGRYELDSFTNKHSPPTAQKMRKSQCAGRRRRRRKCAGGGAGGRAGDGWRVAEGGGGGGGAPAAAIFLTPQTRGGEASTETAS